MYLLQNTGIVTDKPTLAAMCMPFEKCPGRQIMAVRKK
jgi:hypothetical protein